MSRYIVILSLIVLVSGCAFDRHPAGLTRTDRDVLKNYFSSPQAVQQAARICLKHSLSKEAVLSSTSDAMRREVTKDSITFFFAPSQWWTITFDKDGKAIESEITGRKITQKTPSG
jgi:hypothetical protein